MPRKLIRSPRDLLLADLIVLILLGGTYVILFRKGPDAKAAQKVAPAITLPTLDGQTLTLPAQADQVTVLFTMGYWCSDCVAGAKTLAHLQDSYHGRGIRFVAVDITPNVMPEELPPFLDSVGHNQLAWAMDGSGHFAALYAVTALDTAIVLDRQGHEVYRNYLGTSDAEIRAALEKVLTS